MSGGSQQYSSSCSSSGGTSSLPCSGVGRVPLLHQKLQDTGQRKKRELTTLSMELSSADTRPVCSSVRSMPMLSVKMDDQPDVGFLSLEYFALFHPLKTKS